MVETGAQAALNGVSPGSRVSQDGCTPPLSGEGSPGGPLAQFTDLTLLLWLQVPALLEAAEPRGSTDQFSWVFYS